MKLGPGPSVENTRNVQSCIGWVWPIESTLLFCPPPLQPTIIYCHLQHKWWGYRVNPTQIKVFQLYRFPDISTFPSSDFIGPAGKSISCSLTLLNYSRLRIQFLPAARHLIQFPYDVKAKHFCHRQHIRREEGLSFQQLCSCSFLAYGTMYGLPKIKPFQFSQGNKAYEEITSMEWF